VSRFVSIGNQADVDVAEVLEYLADDDQTTLIACFVEALRDGRRFVRAAARATLRKPVVVLKGGRSDAGRRAAGSHTGSLAGRYEVYRAAFRQAGAVVAEETDEFFDAIEALVVSGSTRPATPAVAVITVSGGPSVVAADCAERSGLAVPALDDGVREHLRASLPAFAAVGNPVDLTPQVAPARIAGAVREVFRQPGLGGAVAVNVGLDIPEFADALIAARDETGQPVVAFVADAPAIAERFRHAGVPVLPSPERAVRAWRALWLARPRARVACPDPRSWPDPARLTGDVAARTLHPGATESLTELAAATGALPYRLARRLLERHGVTFCRETIARTADDAVAAAEALGYPVVVKADAAGLAHKSDVGAVRLDVRDAADVRAACEDLVGRLGPVAFVVQERVAPGVELLVGARRDEVFGPIVALGTGGVLAEVVGDVSFRLAPIDDDDAREMLAEGLRPRLLAGVRGLPAVGAGAVARTLHAVAALIVSEPRVLEIDVNPVIAAGDRAVAVDALVVVGDLT
jgi:acyl-CoA synthetase (NDP forming)